MLRRLVDVLSVRYVAEESAVSCTKQRVGLMLGRLQYPLRDNPCEDGAYCANHTASKATIAESEIPAWLAGLRHAVGSTFQRLDVIGFLLVQFGDLENFGDGHTVEPYFTTTMSISTMGLVHI